MFTLLRSLWKDESGQALVEYGLVLGLVAVALIAAVTLFRQSLINLFQNMAASLDAAGGGGAAAP